MKIIQYINKILTITILIAICFSCSNRSSRTANDSSHSIYGEWVEYDDSDPTNTYLITHYVFNHDGTGKFILTDDNREREVHSFRWQLTNGTITINMLGENSYLTFSDGVLYENGIVTRTYYKK